MQQVQLIQSLFSREDVERDSNVLGTKPQNREPGAEQLRRSIQHGVAM